MGPYLHYGGGAGPTPKRVTESPSCVRGKKDAVYSTQNKIGFIVEALEFRVLGSCYLPFSYYDCVVQSSGFHAALYVYWLLLKTASLFLYGFLNQLN